METKIPKYKPSRSSLILMACCGLLYLALVVVVRATPVPEKSYEGKYDYLSSAIWEIYGPTNVVRVTEFRWPGTRLATNRPVCVDPESALDDFSPAKGPAQWCRQSGNEGTVGILY